MSVCWNELCKTALRCINTLPTFDEAYLYAAFVMGAVFLALAFGLHFGKRIFAVGPALLFNLFVFITAVVFYVKFTVIGFFVKVFFEG